MSNPNNQVDTVGMSFLDSLPRKMVTVYLPLLVFLIVLLFPFYWMAITSVKPEAELLSRDGNPFWVIKPTLAHMVALASGRGGKHAGHGHEKRESGEANTAHGTLDQLSRTTLL